MCEGVYWKGTFKQRPPQRGTGRQPLPKSVRRSQDRRVVEVREIVVLATGQDVCKDARRKHVNPEMVGTKESSFRAIMFMKWVGQLYNINDALHKSKLFRCRLLLFLWSIPFMLESCWSCLNNAIVANEAYSCSYAPWVPRDWQTCMLHWCTGKL